MREDTNQFRDNKQTTDTIDYMDIDALMDMNAARNSTVKLLQDGYMSASRTNGGATETAQLPFGFPKDFLVFNEAPTQKAQQGADTTKAIKDLIEKLGDDDFGTRETAQAELKKIGAPALDQLATASKESTDAETQRRAKDLVDGYFQGVKSGAISAADQIAAMKDSKNPEIQKRFDEVHEDIFTKHFDPKKREREVATWSDFDSTVKGQKDRFYISKWDEGGKLFWDTLKMSAEDAKQRSIEPKMALDHLDAGTFDKFINKKITKDDIDRYYHGELRKWQWKQEDEKTGKTEPTKAEEAALREQARQEVFRSQVYWRSNTVREDTEALRDLPAHIGKLRSLGIAGTIDKENLKLLTEKVPQLTQLTMGYNGGIAVGMGGGTILDDKSLAFVAKLPNLQKLDLFGQDITREGLQHLKGLKHLNSLDLSYAHLGDKDAGELKKLFAQLPELKEFKFSQPMAWYYDEKENYKTEPAIQRTGRPRMTDPVVADLRASYPRVKILGRD